MNSGLIAINIAAIIFGSAALYGKLDVSPFWIVAARGAFASIALILVGLFRRKLDSLPPASLRKSLWITGIVLAVHWLTFFASVQLAGVAIATLTFATFPLFTALLVAFFARRLPTLLEVASGATIVVAVSLLADVDIRGTKLLGAFAGLASALSFAYFGIAAKSLTKSISPIMVSIAQNLVVAVCLIPILPFSSPAPTSLSDWFWLLMLGIVTTALMHQLYLFALTKLSAQTCSGFVALEPVYAVIFAWMFFKEPVTVWIFVSGALILGASFILHRAERLQHARL